MAPLQPESVPGDSAQEARSWIVDRRRFLGGAVAAGATALLGNLSGRTPARAGTRASAAAGQVVYRNPANERPYRSAMHLHSSFSEGNDLVGSSLSLQAQRALEQNFDVLYATDHDERVSRGILREAFHFSGVREAERGADWALVEQPAVGLGTSSFIVLTGPGDASPLDPATSKGALRLTGTAAGNAQGVASAALSDAPSRRNMRANISDTVVEVDVFPTQVSGDAWPEVLFVLSDYPASGGRPAGQYSLLYRAVPGATTTTYRRQGLLGIVTGPLPPPSSASDWHTITATLRHDAHAVWPDVLSSDIALMAIFLRVVCQRDAAVDVRFSNLRFERNPDMDMLAMHGRNIAAVQRRYPALALRDALEYSYYHTHINGYGGTRFLHDYGPIVDVQPPVPPVSEIEKVIDDIHAHGGICSWDHPLGTGIFLSGTARQDKVTTLAIQQLLACRAGGVDMVEVAYAERNGCDVPHHLQVGDALSQAFVPVTYTGVSDDHTGSDWAKQVNRFGTSPWAAGIGQPAQMAALRRGRAFLAMVGDFTGAVDLSLEGNRMGSVSVRTDAGLDKRTLTVMAGGIPAGGSVQVLQGDVDYGYTGATPPAMRPVAVLPASSFGTGSDPALTPVEVPVDTSASSFVRVDVLDAAGRIVGAANPVWALREQPPNGVPAYRLGPN